MGVRGELFSTKVALQNRTYFFNVKENRLGDLYLNIVESKNRETGGFERQSVILFAEDLKEFLTGFDESLRVMEKAVREKRKGEAPRSRPEGPRSTNPRATGPRPTGPRTIKPRSEKADFQSTRPKRNAGEGPKRTRPLRTSPNRTSPDRAKPDRTRPDEGRFPDKPRKRVVRRKDY